jgi:hypothetical protein
LTPQCNYTNNSSVDVTTGSAVDRQMKQLVNERGDNRVITNLMAKIEDKLKNSRPSLLPVVKA